MNFIRSQRFENDFGRVGYNCVTIHGDASIRADKAGATFSSNWLIRIGATIDNHATRVLVAGPAFLKPQLYRTRIVRIGRPLNNVIVMLAPVQFADVEAVRSCDSIEGQ